MDTDIKLVIRDTLDYIIEDEGTNVSLKDIKHRVVEITVNYAIEQAQEALRDLDYSIETYDRYARIACDWLEDAVKIHEIETEVVELWKNMKE